MKALDLTGDVFGRLTVMGRAPTRKGRSRWLCQCECGNTHTVLLGSLRSGRTRSCGCLHYESVLIRRDFTGRTNGRLTVISDIITPAMVPNRVRVRCECGTEKEMTKTCFVQVRSCGCLKREATIARNRTHGLGKPPEYAVWASMKDRCGNPNSKSWSSYGGRGIKVCKRWQKFAAFFEDMCPRPTTKHTLDRIDNDGGYGLENCRWVTRRVQARNTSRNVMLTHEGRTMCMKDWASHLGISYSCLKRRRARGLSIRELLAPTCRPREALFGR